MQEFHLLISVATHFYNNYCVQVTVCSEEFKATAKASEQP